MQVCDFHGRPWHLEVTPANQVLLSPERAFSRLTTPPPGVIIVQCGDVWTFVVWFWVWLCGVVLCGVVLWGVVMCCVVLCCEVSCGVRMLCGVMW